MNCVNVCLEVDCLHGHACAYTAWHACKHVCGKIEILRPVTYPPPIHTGGLLSSLKDKHARV